MNSQLAGMVIFFSLLLSVYWTFTNKIVLTGKPARAQSITMKQTEESTEGRREERTEGRREVHVIIKVNGEVKIQRDEETEFHPASVNTQLYHGDVLQLEEDAVVVVLCADKSQWNVPSGTASGVNRGCPKKSPPVLVDVNGNIRPPARGEDEETPSNTLQIVRPRNGIRLTNDKVIIIWKTISEATRYTVQVVQIVDLEDKIIWKKEIEFSNGEDTATAVFQLADDRPRQDKIAYFVRVTAHRENLPELEVEERFYLLNEQ